MKIIYFIFIGIWISSYAALVCIVINEVLNTFKKNV